MCVQKNFVLFLFAQKQESCGVFRFRTENVVVGSEICGPAVAGRSSITSSRRVSIGRNMDHQMPYELYIFVHRKNSLRMHVEIREIAIYCIF